MKDYDFSSRAVRDIESARAWYERQQPDRGNQFVDAVLLAIRSAREHPDRSPEEQPGVRGVGCRRFPYRVYYEVRTDKIIIRGS